MKIHRRIFTVLCSLALIGGAIADPPNAAQAKWHIALVTHVIELTPEQATQFVEKFTKAKPEETAAILTEVIKTCAKDDLVQDHRSASLLSVTMRDGNRAVIEVIREYRYPIEFEGKDGAAVPTAFETRNIGTTVEFEARRGPAGKTWDIDTIFQLVRLADVKVYGNGPAAVEQPIFSTRKISTNITVKAGVPQLVGIVSPDPKVDKKTTNESTRIVIVTARFDEDAE